MHKHMHIDLVIVQEKTAGRLKRKEENIRFFVIIHSPVGLKT